MLKKLENRSMQTLVYILPDKNAGVASVVKNLLKFKTARFKTKVILLHNKIDDERRQIIDDINADEICRITYHGKWSSKMSVYNKICKELDGSSIVISNDGGIELEALNYLNLKVTVSYIMHGDFKHYFNVIKHKSHKLSSIITVSDYLKNKIDNHFELEDDIKVRSIKFPVPEVESNFKTAVGAFQLIFVGSLTDRKGVMSLVTITEGLDRKNVKYQLSIVGSGEKEESLKRAFEQNSKVKFYGNLDHKSVFDLYKTHDIILLPSLGEGLPVVIVEAMKFGLVPMVSNLKSGIPELVAHNVNGFIVDLDHIEAYSEHILYLNKHPKVFNDMSKLCVEKAKEMFNPYKQTERYEDAFVNAKKIKFERKFKNLDYLPMAIAYKIEIILNK